MNLKAINFIKNISYTITSNLISLIVSTLVILIIPKLIGIEEYGYWQLYIFYTSYVGFLHFGWNDGIYLRYGGEEYKFLNKKVFYSQFIQLLVTQVTIALLILIGSFFIVRVGDKNFVIQMVAITMVLTNMRLMFFYILQATNRIKEYAVITMFDRIIYIILIVFFLLIGIRDFKVMIFADLIGKLISLIMVMFSCKDIVFNNIKFFKLSIQEMFRNINAGSKLMFANIASMLIIGIVRFGIEAVWDIETFGKISLTLSISNMMMIFINAVGIIVFPILRRTNQDKLANIYSIMRDFLMVILLGSLLIYFPLKTLMSLWLPQYSDSLMYMALVFPIVIYEGKMALLINTYLKTLRQEKIMLKINLLTMLLSLVMTFITTQIYRSLDLTILNIVILLMIRSVVSESYLSGELNIKVSNDIIFEIILTVIFIISGWYVNSGFTVLIYGFAYLIYLIIKKNDIKNAYGNIKILFLS